MTGDPTPAYVLEGLAVPDTLDRLQDLLERVAADHDDLRTDDLMLFETAVVEVAGNMVKHGRPPGSVLYAFQLVVRDDRLEARLSDSGEPFGDDLPTPAMPDDLSEGGRGLALADAVLDEFRYTRTDDQNVWDMVRRRH